MKRKKPNIKKNIQKKIELNNKKNLSKKRKIIMNERKIKRVDGNLNVDLIQPQKGNNRLNERTLRKLGNQKKDEINKEIIKEINNDFINLNKSEIGVFDIIIVTPFFKRKDIFLIFLENLKKLKNKRINLHAILIGSNSIENEAEMVKSYGFDYVYHENKPLSNKWNYGISFLKEYVFKYLVIMGSDVIVNFNLLNRMCELSNGGEYDILGVLDCYVYEYNEKIGVYWSGYNQKSYRYNEPTGSCRFYSKNFLEKYNYKLYDVGRNTGLDRSATMKFKDYKIYKTKLLKDEYLISLKSKGNDINEFSKFRNYNKIGNLKDIVNSILNN